MDADRPVLEYPAPDETLTIARARGFMLAQPQRAMQPEAIDQYVAACWATCRALGVAPGKAFAQSMVETNNGRFTGQVPLSANNVAGIGATNNTGQYLQYSSWFHGWAAYGLHLLAWLDRLDMAPALFAGQVPTRAQLLTLDPRIDLVAAARATKGKVTSWRSLGGRWAVANGVPWSEQATMAQNYGWKIEQRYNAALAAEPAPTNGGGAMINVFLSAGHHNDSGGSQREYEQTGELCEAVARHLMADYPGAFDVRVAQPDGPDADTEPGDGHLAGSLDVVGNTAVAMSRAGWIPRLTLECHTEGGGGTGVFVIFPDDPTRAETDPNRDYDAAMATVFGPAIAREVAGATGLGVRSVSGAGVMSERRTGVGAGGSRLGYFRTTAPLAATTERCIVEYGAHDKDPDWTIARQPGFADRCGRATAKAIAAYYGVQGGGTMGNESAQLVAFGNAIPFAIRGELEWEGAIDLSGAPFSGGAAEQVAKYEKVVCHRLNGGSYVMLLSLWDAYRKAGKVIQWPQGNAVHI